MFEYFELTGFKKKRDSTGEVHFVLQPVTVIRSISAGGSTVIGLTVTDSQVRPLAGPMESLIQTSKLITI